MIIETIISTVNKSNLVNFAPFGIKRTNKYVFISPYIPSVTLNNLLINKSAVVNYIDDAEFFVKCIIGEKNFKKKSSEVVKGFFLENSLSHDEVEVVKYLPDNKRPTFKCKIVFSKYNKPFKGLNRARAALIEACILATRTKFLKKNQISRELNYLSNAIEKTSGKKEFELWKKINNFINQRYKKNETN